MNPRTKQGLGCVDVADADDDLASLCQRMRESGGKLTLENTPSIVANLLRLLKLSKLFAIDPPSDDATSASDES